MYGDKGYVFSNVPEGDERITIPRLYSCVQREQRVQHLLESKTAAMPLSGSSGEFSAGSEPVRPENPDPEDPGGAGGAHDPMRYDAVMQRIR